MTDAILSRLIQLTAVAPTSLRFRRVYYYHVVLCAEYTARHGTTHPSYTYRGIASRRPLPTPTYRTVWGTYHLHRVAYDGQLIYRSKAGGFITEASMSRLGLSPRS